MKDWRYILYISLAVGVFVLLKLLAPKQYDWQVTFKSDDKNPYGGYVFGKMLPTLFNDSVKLTNETIYEIKDSLDREGSLIIISQGFHLEESDLKSLLSFVDKGGSAFISNNYSWGHFDDTLSIHKSQNAYGFNLNSSDSAYLTLTNGPDSGTKFYFEMDNIDNYFASFDTTKVSVINRNSEGNPTTIRVPFGKGQVILNSTPMIFTNIYLNHRENHKLFESLLSYIPDGNVIWTSYYQTGRSEASTPLRYILKEEGLAWAYYLTICSLLVFILFELKRRQRIIPIIPPVENNSLEFIQTVGNLYFQSGDHKNVATKRINYFLDQIRSRYYISTLKLDEAFIQLLIRRSGKPDAIVHNLITTINKINKRSEISKSDLIDLSAQMDKFAQSSQI